MSRKYRRLKRILGVSAILLSLLIANLPAVSFAETPSDIQAASSDFVIENGVLTNYTGSGGDVVIPEGVTSIGDFAFSWCNEISSVTIPDGVTSIGRGAFSSCHNLSSVTIPSSVTSIEGDAFASCTSLSSVTIPESVTHIGDGAFYGCNLTTVTIPSSVQSIEYSAFRCPNLTEMTILNPQTELEEIFAGHEGFDGYENRVITIKGYADSTAQTMVERDNQKSAYYKATFRFLALDGTGGGNDDTPTLTVTDDRNDKENTTALSATVTNLNEDLFLSVKDSAGVVMNSLITLSNGMSLKAYDLTLVNASGKAASDFGSCTITLPIPSTMDVSKGTVQAMAVKTDGTLEKFNTEIIDVNGVKCARFTTTHFSEYALVYTANADNGGGGTGESNDGGGNGGSDGNTGNDNAVTPGSTDNNTNPTNVTQPADAASTAPSSNSQNSANTNNSNDNASTPGSTDNNTNPTNVTQPADATSTAPYSNSQTRANINNADDMPKTGDGDEIKMLIAASLFLFGCIEIISSISIRKKVKVRVRR